MSTPMPFRFDSALVRSPARSVVHGLRADHGPEPSLEGIEEEHLAYCTALRAAGLQVSLLPPLPEYPDSIFVEDPALVFTGGAILLRPGAVSRAGEVAEIAAALRERFDTVLELATPGTVEGGDVLVTPRGVLIGLSARTDQAGAGSLVDCLARLGQRGQIVATPPGVLHFKSDCALLDEETVLSTRRLAESGVFDGLRQILVAEGEEAAANAVRINDVVLLSSGFPRTHEQLDQLGYQVVPLATTQVARLDAGLSCLSLRWLRWP